MTTEMKAAVDSMEAKLNSVMGKDNPLSEYLAIAEKKTGLSRNKLLAIGGTLVGVALVVGYAAQLLSGLIGFLYPAYYSVRALVYKHKEEEHRWLTYWVVFSFFHVIEFFSDHLVWWLPAYWFAKTLLLVWCMAPPPYSGSEVLYNRMIKPAYISYHGEIDSALDKAKSKAADFLDRGMEKAKVLGKEAMENKLN